MAYRPKVPVQNFHFLVMNRGDIAAKRVSRREFAVQLQARSDDWVASGCSRERRGASLKSSL